MAEISWDAFSKEDANAILQGRYDQVSEPGLRLLTGDAYDTSEVLARGAERGFTSTLRGIAELFGAEKTEEDLKREQEFRAMLELNPGAAITGNVAGSVFDPTNAIPLAKAKTIGQFFRQGVGVGTAAGLLEPTYEDYNDSRMANVAFGAATGGIAGAGLGYLAKKLAGKEGNLADELVDKAQKDLQAAVTNPSDKNTFLNANLDTLLQRKLRETENVPTPSATPDPSMQFKANISDQNALPVLPKDLASAAPRYFRSVLQFDNDIDRALYAVGSPGESKRHKDYVKWLVGATNLPENELLKLAKQAHAEIKQTSKDFLLSKGLKGIKEVDTIPIKTSKTLDNLINPIEKHLDNDSKLVYNYGKTLEQSRLEGGKIRLNLKDPGFQNVHALMKAANPEITEIDSALTAQGYQRLLQHMKNEYGPKFSATSIQDFLKNPSDKIDAFIVAHKAGDFEGCQL